MQKKVFSKRRRLRRLERIKNSRFTLALVMIIIGTSYTISWYEGVKYMNDYKQVMRFIEEYSLIKSASAKNDDTPVIQAEVHDMPGEEELINTRSFSEIGLFYSYNADPAQTDSTPTVTANGEKVYEGGIANNCLPFGTQIEIEDMGIFTVNDRMNSRYGCEVFDIFMWDIQDSLNFGKKELSYVVIN